MYNISYDFSELEEFGQGLKVLIQNMEQIPNILTEETQEIAAAVASYIWNRIMQEHPNRDLAARIKTSLEQTPYGAIIRFHGDPTVFSKDNGYDVWAAQESGIPAVEGKFMIFNKDDGSGQWVRTTKRSEITKYAGVTEAIIESSMFQANMIARELVKNKTQSLMAEAISDAFNLKISSGAEALLTAHNLLGEIPAGTTEAMINPLTGGVSLRGPGGRFVVNPGSMRGIRIA